MDQHGYVITTYFFILSVSSSAGVYVLYLILRGTGLSAPIFTLQTTSIEIEAKSKVSTTVLKFLLLTSLTFLWYSISISFTIYNKWLMGSFKGGFDYPITTTLMHTIVKYIFSTIWISYFYGNTITPVSLEVYTNIIVPIGLSTGLDITMSNVAVSFLTISVYTIIKATVVGWTFLWGTVSGLEIFSFQKLFSIAFIVIGTYYSLGINVDVLRYFYCYRAIIIGIVGY